MKRRKGNQKEEGPLDPTDAVGLREARTHIRRCHICDQVSEADGSLVESCRHCGKPMAPFFFFDEVAVEPLSDEGVRLPPLPGQRAPVRGLTVYW